MTAVEVKLKMESDSLLALMVVVSGLPRVFLVQLT